MFTQPINFLGGAGKEFPVVESTSQANTCSTSLYVPLPSGCSIGDLVVLCIGSYGGASINTPAGWSSIVSYRSGNASLKCIYKTIDGAEGAGVTISSSSSTHIAVNAYRISGASEDIEYAVTGTSGNRVNPPSCNASWGVDKNLWLAVGVEYSYQISMSAPANYSSFLQRANVSGGIDYTRVASAIREYEDSSNENPDVFGGSLSGGYSWSAATIVIKPK